MLKILVVEDEPAISRLIQIALENAGYLCESAPDGEVAADMIEDNEYSLILLDIMLPGFDGFELMEYIRPTKTPVIFLTAKGSLKDRVKGLKLGADDYIVKPFEVEELIARVEAVLRRTGKSQDIYRIGSLTVDTVAMRVTKDGKDIPLAPKETEILILFLENPNTAIYRERIYSCVWGGELPYGSKTVDLHVQRLRKKTGLTKEIVTVSKIGYRLEVPT